MSWTVLVLIICCALAVFAVWKEYSRSVKKHLIWRIVAALMAVIAFGFIAIPIHYLKDINIQDDHSAVLLTDGFVADSLGSFKNSKLFTTDKAIAKKYPKAKLIRLDELKIDSPAITRLHVLGYGLNKDELDQLDSLSVVFHPSALSERITAINWNQKLNSGETLKVQGKYKNDRSEPIKLILKGLSTQLNAVIIPAKSEQNFELSAVPKNEGRAVYHIQVISGNDTLANENLPVEIDPVKPLKILMLSAAPDFETRFLKNWLSENGFSVAVRSAITKDKFSSEYVNMQPVNMDRLSESLLDKFDVVIGDLSVLKSESAVLKQAVTQKGLGLIIRADTISKTSSWLQNDFPVEKLQVKDAPAPLMIKGEKNKTVALKIDPIFIKYQSGTQHMVTDAQNHVLVNASLAGAGRLLFKTVNNTYNWVLAGDKNDYAAFWSLLISNAARKVPVTEEWSAASQLPSVNEPVQMQLATSSSPLQITAENAMIAPSQNPDIPFEWGNNYWPSSTGWHSILQKNGKSAWWYVYGKDNWKGVKASEKISATRFYAIAKAVNTSVTKAIHKKVRIEVPKIYFYVMLLMACTYLWVERKSLTLPSPKERVL
ncbi:hypothetical protein ACPPVU_06420 [Mucilaginibacter sp. McL0603]|uniref:hypothetical protein n=1 Tax=Mucilaginibacter sp. McL0603 TaxID=3415670 RepID=UPI003CF58C7C